MTLFKVVRILDDAGRVEGNGFSRQRITSDPLATRVCRFPRATERFEDAPALVSAPPVPTDAGGEQATDDYRQGEEHRHEDNNPVSTLKQDQFIWHAFAGKCLGF